MESSSSHSNYVSVRFRDSRVAFGPARYCQAALSRQFMNKLTPMNRLTLYGPSRTKPPPRASSSAAHAVPPVTGHGRRASATTSKADSTGSAAAPTSSTTSVVSPEAAAASTADANNLPPPVVKKKMGRPRKHPLPEDTNTSSALNNKATTHLASSAATVAPTARPVATVEVAVEPTTVPKPAKGRGRPKATTTSPTAASTFQAEGPVDDSAEAPADISMELPTESKITAAQAVGDLPPLLTAPSASDLTSDSTGMMMVDEEEVSEQVHSSLDPFLLLSPEVDHLLSVHNSTSQLGAEPIHTLQPASNEDSATPSQTPQPPSLSMATSVLALGTVATTSSVAAEVSSSVQSAAAETRPSEPYAATLTLPLTRDRELYLQRLQASQSSSNNAGATASKSASSSSAKKVDNSTPHASLDPAHMEVDCSHLFWLCLDQLQYFRPIDKDAHSVVYYEEVLALRDIGKPAGLVGQYLALELENDANNVNNHRKSSKSTSIDMQNALDKEIAALESTLLTTNLEINRLLTALRKASLETSSFWEEQRHLLQLQQPHRPSHSSNNHSSSRNNHHSDTHADSSSSGSHHVGQKRPHSSTQPSASSIPDSANAIGANGVGHVSKKKKKSGGAHHKALY